MRYKKRSLMLINNINITPFVDVMLVLLIVFMIASPMIVPSISVDLPSTSASPSQADDRPVVVTIAKNEMIYVQDKLVNLPDLVKNVKIMAKDSKDLRVFIRGDEKTSYGIAVKVIAMIRLAGFNKVAIVTSSEAK